MARAVWHPEIVWHDPPDFPDRTRRRGAQAVASHLKTRLEATGPAKMTVTGAAWMREGEFVLVELSLRTIGPASGVQLDVPLFHIVRIADGRSVEVWEYMDRRHVDEALRGEHAPHIDTGGGSRP